MRSRYGRVLATSLLLAVPLASARADSGDDVLVQRFLQSLRATPLATGDLPDSLVEWQESEQHVDTNLRVALLKKQDKQVGYILFLGRPDDSWVPVAFSGSDFPDDLIAQVSVPDLQGEPCSGATGVLEDVPMVPAVTSHGVPLVSPLDASASSMLNYWQLFKGRYLFDHIFVLDPRTDLPFPKQQTAFPPADMVRDYPPPPPGIPGDPNQQTLEFRKQVSHLINSIHEDFATPSGHERLPTREIAESIRIFEGVNTVSKKWLASNLIWPIRKMITTQEQRDAGGPFTWTDPGVSPLVADAFLVGRGYVSDAETPEAGIASFFHTRAVPLKCRREPFTSWENTSPGILLSPTGRAYVLTGKVEIQGECWAVVVDPATVRPIVRKHKDRFASVRRAQGRPTASSRPTRHPLPDEELERRRAEDEVLLSDCPMTGSPDAIRRGLHYFRTALLNNWTVLTVTEE